MKKTIVAFVSLVWLFIVTFGSRAQTTVKLPAKAYPVKVPHKTDAGVDRYWHVTQILCLGPSSGGYKFRIYGKAAKSSSSHTINMMYLLPNNRVQIAGAYIFPAITEGKSFKFDIVSAFKGYAPSSFNGFFIHDEALARILENERREAAQKVETVSPPPALPEIQNIVEDAIADTEIPSTEQQPSKTEKDENIYDTVEQMPEFPGGLSACMSYIARNVKYPTIALENGIQGRVVVQFCVEKDGSISNTVVTKSVNPYLDKEALRVVSSMPKWTPGKQKGKPVRVKYTLPVHFRLK